MFVMLKLKQSLFSFVPHRTLRTLRHRKLRIPSTEKRLDCVILGAPNAGKSVLLNTLLGTKLAATSRKKHTTRLEILGVFNHRNCQLAFYDTPGYTGLHQSQGSKPLREVAIATAAKADVVLIVVDSATRLDDKAKDTFAEMVHLGLRHAKKEIILVLNKVDLVNPKIRLLERTYDLVSLINGIKLGPEKQHLARLDTTTFMISALHNDGVIDLKNYLISISDMKPWTLQKEAGCSLLSPEERVEQIILEKMLDHTHEEIPYIADITCRDIENLSTSRLKIEVDIQVDTSGQQRIVVGHQGRTLVKVRQASVEALETIFKKQVILYLWVNLRGSTAHGNHSAQKMSEESRLVDDP